MMSKDTDMSDELTKLAGDAFERRVIFEPAFDRRDPNPSKNYGIGAVRICFVLKGPKGAVQWMICTDWYLPHNQLDLASRGHGSKPVQPRAWDLGYHSPEPMYEDQTAMSGNCHILGGQCFYDGSGLNAERLLEPFLREGDAAVWRELEAYYASTFAAGEPQ